MIHLPGVFRAPQDIKGRRNKSVGSYENLATFYDRLTLDVDYVKWAEYLHKQLETHHIPGNMLLDLACGTGSLTFALADLGYEMIGADISSDMLSQAMEKSYDYSGQKPVFLCQSMDNLDLYGTIDGCVCCLDSVNYITEPKILQTAFERVSLFLMPGGLFLFDIKSPFAFVSQDGQFSLDESEDFYCVWRTELSENQETCQHLIDLFQKEGKHWIREEEIHQQRIYQPETLVSLLESCGFHHITQYGNLSQHPPHPEEERIFILAEKKKS